MSEIQELTNAVLSLKEDLDERHEQNTAHYREIERQVERLGDRVEGLAQGFPKGAVKHAHWHEGRDLKEERASRLWAKTLEGFTGPALYALITGLLYLAYLGAKPFLH
jgi:hypothetical protein